MIFSNLVKTRQHLYYACTCHKVICQSWHNLTHHECTLEPKAHKTATKLNSEQSSYGIQKQNEELYTLLNRCVSCVGDDGWYYMPALQIDASSITPNGSVKNLGVIDE